MNFELGAYNVRLTFNPADVTIRMEHRENRRLYESVFMTEDFDGLAAIGGLTTIEKILIEAFRRTPNATITIIEEKMDTLILKVAVNGLIAKSWTLALVARHRESGDAAVEVEEIRAKIKELEDRAKKLEDIIPNINSKIKTVEDAMPIPIILAGCPFVIQITNTLKLSDHFAKWEAISCCHCPIGADRISTYNTNQSCPNHIQCISGHWKPCSITQIDNYKTGLKDAFNIETNEYIFTGSDLRPLVKAKHILQTLSITSNAANYSTLKELTQLRKLEIHCLKLSDISWAKHLKCLTELNLEGCTSLSDVNVLAELPALTKLNIKGTGVKNTAALTNSRLTIEK